jgi:WD40 repeat protein
MRSGHHLARLFLFVSARARAFVTISSARCRMMTSVTLWRQLIASVLFLLLQEAAKKLEEEANKLGLFGSITDWSGAVRQRTFDDFRRLHVRVGPSHLKHLACTGADLWRQKEWTGSLSMPCTLLRTKGAQRAGGFVASEAIVQRTRVPFRGVTNELLTLRARELGLGRNHKWRPHIYKRIEFQASIMGHFCAVYCLTFDRTGLRYITGSDDKLIKIWVSRSGILLHSLRGHVHDITDLAVSCDNRFLASSSNDLDVRIWWLHNGAPLAVLPGHTICVHSVRWSPTLNMDLSQQLYSWGNDGTLRMWSIDANGAYCGCQIVRAVDTPATIMRSASMASGVSMPNQISPSCMNCATFDPLRRWVAVGCADTLIRVFLLGAPNAPVPNVRPTRLSGHTGEIEHLTASTQGDLIVSGSADGSIRLWPLSGVTSGGLSTWPLQVDYQRARVLNIRTGEQASGNRNATSEKHKLNTLVLNRDDTKVVTSQALEKKKKDNSWLVRVKVWDVDSGELLHNFNNHHEQQVHVLECHPTEPNVVASAGYDARVYFWDILKGECVAKFQITFRYDDRLNPVGFDQNSAEILDGKWNPDGISFMTSHKNGFASIMSVSNHTDAFKKTPREQFFPVDFGELVMDQQRNVIDRAAQVPPHTLPNGPLCDRFGTQLGIENLAGDMVQSHPLLVSPPRVTRQQASDMGFPDADARMAAELAEEEEVASESSGDEDFVEGESDDEDDDDYTNESREERREKKRQESRLKRQQSERDRRAVAFAERRYSQRPSRRTQREDDDDMDSSYSEGDLSESELFVLPKKKKVREDDRTGWQPEQQRRRALTESELAKNISRSRNWLMVTTPPKNVDHGYVPQIGDVVVYFLQGHEEQLCEFPEAQCQRAQQPWEEFKLKAAEKCEITDIKYQIPATNEPAENKVYCILHLKRLPDNLAVPKPGCKFAKGQPIKARWKKGHRFNGVVMECNDDGTYDVQFDDGDRENAEPEDMMFAQTFIVSFRQTDFAEFVLPLYRYERHEHVYGPGDRFKMLYEGEPEPYFGTVKILRPFHPKDYPDSPWQCLEVRWDKVGEGDEDTAQVSPWEIMPESEDQGPPPVTSDLSDTERKRLQAVLEEEVMVTDLARPFVQPLDSALLAYVPLPLCLQTVVARLDANFYRSREMVAHDLKLICRNASLAARPQDGLMIKRSLILEDVFQEVLANGDVAQALSKWDESAEGACSAAAAGAKSGQHKGAGGSSGGVEGCGSGLRVVTAKVSPETMWKSAARAAVEDFNTAHANTIKGLTAAASSEPLSEMQAMVEAWPCCEYEAFVSKVTAGDYSGLTGANSLGYDLLCACFKALLLSPSIKREAHNALLHALSLVRALKATHPHASANVGPVHASRRRGDSSIAYKPSLESLVALDSQKLLNEVPLMLPTEAVFEGILQRCGAPEDTKLPSIKTLLDMVEYAERYRSAEEVSVDLMLLCGNAMLHRSDEILRGEKGDESLRTVDVYGTAASVVAKGIQMFPKPKAISLKISLGRGHDKRDNGKGRADCDSDRMSRTATRQSGALQVAPTQHTDRSSVLPSSGEGTSGRQPAARGVDASVTSGIKESSAHRAVSIECQGTKEWLKKCMAKLRAVDAMGIFEHPVTDELAPGYSKAILHPMCFAKMEMELERGGYDRLPQLFVADMLLIVANALIFNEPGDIVSDAALALAKRGINLFADKLPEWNALLESSVAGSDRAVCMELQAQLKSLKSLDSVKLFAAPVSESEVPGYSSVIKLPMDLMSMEQAMQHGRYP